MTESSLTTHVSPQCLSVVRYFGLLLAGLIAGVVCRQLAVAWWGETGIPDPWRDGLAGKPMIEAALKGIM